MRKYLDDWAVRITVLMLLGVAAGSTVYMDRWPLLAWALIAVTATAAVASIVRARGEGERS